MAKISRLKKFIFFWLGQETQDVSWRLRTYPKIRLIIFSALLLNFFGFIFLLWSRINSPIVKSVDDYVFTLLPFRDFWWWRWPFEFISFLASIYFVLPVGIVIMGFLFLRRFRKAVIVAVFFLASNSLLGAVLKDIFERPRPFFCLEDKVGLDGCLSFPSGHSLTAIYFYGLLVFLIFRFGFFSLKSFLWLVLGVGVLIALIGFSRVALGVHYPSDVVGGYFLGLTCLWAAILLIDLLYHEKK